MTTICSACAHVHPDSVKQPWLWMCALHPRMDGFGFVTHETWDKFPPFLFCKDLNAGACPLYEEKSNEDIDCVSN